MRTSRAPLVLRALPKLAAAGLAAVYSMLVMKVGMGTVFCANNERIFLTAEVLWVSSLVLGVLGMRFHQRRSELFIAAAALAISGLFAITIGADLTDCRNSS